MGFLAVSLFILACGWKLYRDYIPTKAKAIRSLGHPQYFGAALAAGLVFVLALSVHTAAQRLPIYGSLLSAISDVLPRSEDARVKVTAPSERVTQLRPVVIGAPLTNSKVIFADQSGKPEGVIGLSPLGKGKDDFLAAVSIAAWALFIAVVLPFLLNQPYMANRHLRYVVARGDLEVVETILASSVRTGLTVAVSLSNGKVYIGVPLETGQGGLAESQWIQIQPLASGYRNEQGELVITTGYKQIYDKLKGSSTNRIQSSDFKVVVPKSQIVTVQNFDLATYLENFGPEAQAAEGDSPALDAAGVDRPLVIPGDGLNIPWWCMPNAVAPDDAEVRSESGPKPVAAKAGMKDGTLSLVVRSLNFIYGLGLAGGAIGIAYKSEYSMIWLLSLLSLLALCLCPTGRWGRT
ncbi:hypothetical protein [Stenotrophomonas maltophilia]|uniref:hypothetical protein n=1 Tax=Stenotrophomonas maltophilia TaxID=40324 RepID=UPI001FA71195|nr:hypothetical protein [Stenotrophomonas maltophilia]